MKKKEPRKQISLDNGVLVTIPVRFSYASCRCGKKDIVWAITEKNKRPTPVRWSELKEAWISHFADCPLAKDFRKKGNKK